MFKALRAAGLLTSVVARVKPVPQTKRMKDKYTVDKCSLTAKLMREGCAMPDEVMDDEDDGDGSEEEEEKKGGKDGKKVGVIVK